MAAQIGGILFDFGGVIAVFYQPDRFQGLEAQLGLAPGSLPKILWHSDEWQQAQVGAINDEEYWRRTAPKLGLHTPEALNNFRRAIYADVTPDPRMVGLIRGLRRRYRLGLLSNTSAADPQHILGRHGLDGLFDAVILSAAVGLAKPDPAIYRLALARLGTAPEATVFIDDWEPNARAAADVGLQAIHFTGYENLLAELRALGVESDQGEGA
jgi:epoxide hydrolase-like predicted phosphatase